MNNIRPLAKTAPPGKVVATQPPAVPPSPPQWLVDWRVTDPVPVPAPVVLAALEDAQRALVPADLREVLIKLDQTMQLWRLPAAWDTVADFYLEALEDLPSDLVDLALKRVRLRHRYPEAPKPADFREAVRQELAARQLAEKRLRVAEWKARAEEARERPHVEQETIALAAGDA